MRIEPLDIEGAWQVTPRQHGDSRGLFLELFAEPAFRESVGHGLHLAQANCSVSSKDTVRGIHFADVPPGQAKYISCLSGALLDVIVDLRVGSPTFGKWTSVRLDTDSRRAVYLSEGLGHGFAALEDNTTAVYLCSVGYTPQREHEVNPFDPDLGIDWGLDRGQAQVSAKDREAPTLSEAAAAGQLPDFATCQSFRSGLT